MIAEEVPNLNSVNLLQYVTEYVISEKLGKTPKIPRQSVINGSNQNGKQE